MAIRKKFISVEIPLIGEIVEVLGTPESLNKKVIKLDLSRKLRGKNLEIKFQIFNKDNILTAFPKKMTILKSYLKKVIRKGTSNVEDSFKINSKDIQATIKPFLITRKKVSRAVRKNLRNTTKELLINYVKEKNYLEICSDLLEGNLQQKILPKLKKIYPLSFCDIRVLETREIENIDLSKEKVKKVEVAEEKKEKPKKEAKVPAEEKPKGEKKKTVKKKEEEEKPAKKLTVKKTKKISKE